MIAYYNFAYILFLFDVLIYCHYYFSLFFDKYYHYYFSIVLSQNIIYWARPLSTYEVGKLVRLGRHVFTITLEVP